ncbi:MAG TPA: lantibiotic dehydratase, partial [Pedobacter sp.]
CYMKESRNYQICSVAHNEYLEKIIEEAEKGRFIDEIVEVVCRGDEDIAASDVLDFLDELIDSQILISELEPSVTGGDFLSRIIELLTRIETDDHELMDTIAILNEISYTLKKIDDYHKIDGYRHIVRLVEKLGVNYEEGKLFHADIYKQELSGGIHTELKNKLSEAVGLLNRITPYFENVNLKNFRNNFYNRYEEREMPLLKVLDTETGVGYLNNIRDRDITPLLDDIALPVQYQAGPSIVWNDLEQLLHKKTIESLDNTIELDEEDLKPFQANWDNLLPSFSLMFRILSEDEIFIENCGGSSAVNLLGRFAHGLPEIGQIAKDITGSEQDAEENVIFAEIVHLPENRTANILLHPSFRKYEIPYLSNASVADEYTIELSDLYVAVRNNKIILRSRRLNKVIIPRLSNAHNYTNNTLPVYQFLCDLQNQGKRSNLYFSWGGLNKIHVQLPRVKYKGIILSLAQWNFKREYVEHIINSDAGNRNNLIRAFRNRWSLPRYVVLADGDNELFIDFDNEQLVSIWIDYIKKRSETILKEFISSKFGVKDKISQDNFSNQVIALIQNKKTVYQEFIPKMLVQSEARRKFSLGSEWIYFKIYCGVRSADKILLNIIKPISEELESGRHIDKWFFIRYSDPEFHLRVRFHTSDLSGIAEIIRVFSSYANQYIASGIIWKVQNDTYEREIERYGSDSIEIIESIFHQDSKAVVEMLKIVQDTEGDNFRWMWAIKSVDELFNSFSISIDQRFHLIDMLKDTFAAEFNSNRFLKLQLDNKYRLHRGKLDKWLENDGLLLGDPNELVAIRTLFERTKYMFPFVYELNHMDKQEILEVSMSTLLISLIHMVINRIITSQPRVHEMIIYDFMSRSYKSRIVRAKLNNQRNDEIEFPALKSI